MKKFLAGLALSVALVTGGAVVTAPAQAAGIYVRVGGGDHYCRHHYCGPHHRYWRHHHRGYYWHNRYWEHRYWCDHHHRRWCYR